MGEFIDITSLSLFLMNCIRLQEAVSSTTSCRALNTSNSLKKKKKKGTKEKDRKEECDREKRKEEKKMGTE